MSQEIYNQILDLKSRTDAIDRGRDFEALMREIQPWDHRPPIVASPKSEQLDGVFVYKGETFIIESKAVRKKITPGMSEWEDFELKLRRRTAHGVIGMFCSLFDICDTVMERAKEMNMTGIRTIIIAGKTWDELSGADIHFPSFLDYLMLMCSLKNSPSVDSLKNAKSWIYDGNTINDSFTDNAKKISSTFLRRFKHKFHEQLFVERSIDVQIRSLMAALSPRSLKSSGSREGYKQLMVVRDFSGSGKTTMSANLAAYSEHCFCFATTANISQVDEVLDHFLHLNKYPGYGLNELIAVDKPLLFIVDSLDETPLHSHVAKRREIRSLIKKVEELNNEAVKKNLAVFPIAVLFTIREEYWRDWEASFEGRQDVVSLKKIISHYNKAEFQLALEQYTTAYHYKILNFLTPEAENILSVPINLEIFSEANYYEGEISVEDIWEGKILSSYFAKKEESLFKHYIDQFSTQVFYVLVARLAFSMLQDRTTLFSKTQFRSILASISEVLALNNDQILLNLVSEQIVINDTDNASNYRFKYIRFIEYLVALNIIQEFNAKRDFSEIDFAIQTIYDSNIVSVYGVLDNIKHICRVQFRQIEKDIIDYYSHSETFLQKYLPELRGKIARGEGIPKDAIKSIITNDFIQSPITSWNSFFIIAAKSVHEKKDKVIAAFVLAWEKNRENKQRWKMIARLASRDYLLEERVLYALIKDSRPREWEEYFGTVLSRKMNIQFLDLWGQLRGDSIFNPMVEKHPQDWHLANRLLSLIYRNEGFIIGDMLSDEKPKSYVVFDKVSNKKLPDLDQRQKQLCDDYIEELNARFVQETPRVSYPYFFVKELNKESVQYLNIKLEQLFKGTYGVQEKPFLNFLIDSLPISETLFRIVRENHHLEIPVNLVDKQGFSVFREVLECDYQHKNDLFEYLFKCGYKKNDDDDKNMQQAIQNSGNLNAKELEDLLIGFCYLKIKKPGDYDKLNKVYRELCVLLSARFNRIISFRFPNFVQVANNALEHYKEYSDLFLRAFETYGRTAELESKPSYIKKVQALERTHPVQSKEFDSIFESIFPELF